MSRTKELSTVHVAKFPRLVWQTFSGLCRMKGWTIKEGLELALREFLKKHGRATL